MGLEKQPNEPPELSFQLLRENFTDGIVATLVPQGDETAVVRAEFLTKIMDFLKNDPRLLFNVLVDITAVDYFERKPRFDVVYHLLSLRFNRRLRIKVLVKESQPTVDSLTSLWGSADWLEREVWDMFGISFSGHSNLKLILMYEGFEGHPLRKDYPIQKRQPRIGPKI